MAQTGTQVLSQGTSQSTRNLSLSNYYRQQQEMRSTQRSNKTSFRTRVVQSNFRGRPIDKLTQEIKNPDLSDTRSIYQADYTGNQGLHSRYQFLSPQTDRVKPSQQTNGDTNSGAKTNTVQLVNGNANGAGLQINPQPVDPSLATAQSARSSKMRMKYTSEWEPFFKIPKRVNRIHLDYKGVGSSLYQRDFIEHPADAKTIVIKNDLYTTLEKRQALDNRSTMRTDYKDWHMNPPTREGPNRGLGHQIPFGGKSNYQSEFVDWGTNAINYERPVQPITIIPELKLKGRTLYKDNFGAPSAKKEENTITQKMKEQVFSQSIPFLGESNYQKDFRGFKVAGNPNFSQKKPEYNPGQTYAGNFRTTFTADFASPRERVYWPGENVADDEYLSKVLPVYSTQLID